MPSSKGGYLDDARSVLREMALALGAERTEVSELPGGESVVFRLYVGRRCVVVVVAGRELARLLSDHEMESQIRERLRAALATLGDG